MEKEGGKTSRSAGDEVFFSWRPEDVEFYREGLSKPSGRGD